MSKASKVWTEIRHEDWDFPKFTDGLENGCWEIKAAYAYEAFREVVVLEPEMLDLLNLLKSVQSDTDHQHPIHETFHRNPFILSARFPKEPWFSIGTEERESLVDDFKWANIEERMDRGILIDPNLPDSEILRRVEEYRDVMEGCSSVEERKALRNKICANRINAGHKGFGSPKRDEAKQEEGHGRAANLKEKLNILGRNRLLDHCNYSPQAAQDHWGKTPSSSKNPSEDSFRKTRAVRIEQRCLEFIWRFILEDEMICSAFLLITAKNPDNESQAD